MLRKYALHSLVIVACCCVIGCTGRSPISAPTQTTNNLYEVRLDVMSISPARISLAWSAGGAVVPEIRVFRETGALPAFSEIAVLTTNTGQFEDIQVQAGILYTYYISVRYSDGSQIESNPVEAIIASRIQ